MTLPRPWLAAVAVLAVVGTGCADRVDPTGGRPSPTPAATAPASPAASSGGTATPAATAAGQPPPADTPGPADASAEAADRHARPAWLGTRELPLRPDGFGEVLPAPPELVDRRLAPPPSPLPDPPAGAGYEAAVEPVSAEVLARSTWSEGCPVSVDDLAYVTLRFWGFDGRPHTGELLVHADWADEVAGVFGRLYEARFPIEQMRIVEDHELDAAPTGDGNNTTSFVCRPVAGGSSWSEHARGLAIDVNPFHNPYVRGDLVLPELASAYVDRDHRRPGMVGPGGPVVSAFEEIGWGWGGRWDRPVDWMHFSATGR